MASLYQQCWDLRLFLSSVLAIITFPLPYSCTLLSSILVIIDITQQSLNKKSLSLTYYTTYTLYLIPYLVFTNSDLSDPWSLSFFIYSVSLSTFHLGEFLVQSYFHYPEANFSSKFYSAFLLDHSKEYSIAIVMALLEHFLKLLLPYPVFFPLIIIGSVVTAIGHIFRIGSEINCGRNFSHKIRYRKQDDHELIKTGFYR